MKKKIKIPKFKNEDEERDFWLKLDLSKHFERSDFERVFFPNLKPSSRPISLRLPLHLSDSEMGVEYGIRFSLKK
ncbi:MAG: hypothetical protein US45_C0055G0005 [Candidatus Nomurabacteria bacterium GW2011_GWA1_37_20]|uniref:Uncharacterized protein n=2 Tax=Parcubacteria group TaxID=1794811 RepID=A0A0G0I8A1_9BACT|nr:MAG: hypothetical protein US41_C0011G0006 [Parcubacteria group bacterium GW2011_GWB1_37_13]KKQ29911.1 MAG: hypothetical protein US45_C0055G0005 [Candidatus Nomurabacteria bacterium GW2011_GWA1_37_20]KKQ47190.1 MAG: hypothetical protein US65_C0014G0002 [Candidatus Yanofskybacteria bacterium GW2011_GWC2_37_9]